MARPTLAQQLAAAAAAGDLTKVQELAGRLSPPAKKKKAKTKPSKVNKIVKSTKKADHEEEDFEDYEEYNPDGLDDLDDPGNLDDNSDYADNVKANPKPSQLTNVASTSDFIVAARDPNKSAVYIDENGIERTRMKVVPFKAVKNRKNTFKDNGVANAADADFDAKVHKNGVFRGEGRDPVKKVKIKCIRCNEVKILWPGEIMHRNFICDECLSKNKR
jgi:hypothetical protein